jgi:hypothetical protein
MAAASAVTVLVLAARQPEFAELLEDSGFEVKLRTRPLDGFETVDADLAVVFRGRLIGRNQASALAERGIPVVEVLTVEPPSPSTAGWIRLSNRIAKSDLAQVVLALADWSRTRGRVPIGSA